MKGPAPGLARPDRRLVDHLFRHAAGRMTAQVARLVGPARLDLAEEVVQDALVRALETWPHKGVPENPAGWLYQVARNRALDILNREGVGRRVLEASRVVSFIPPAPDTGGLGDEELAVMFMCCHPDMARPARLALTLKLVAGFSVEEIAAALLDKPAAVSQRLVRAKRQIRDDAIPLEVPAREALGERLETVLEALYLLFNEGYSAHAGENLVRVDLCAEAIRLCRILAGNPHTAAPRVDALLSVMLLHASRLPARADGAGEVMLLAGQDRQLWDPALIAEGLDRLDRSAEGDEISAYHVEAAIAASHVAAPDWGSTNWARVLGLYDDLLSLKPSPVVALNRAVALAEVEGPDVALAWLEREGAPARLETYHLCHAVIADLRRRAGDAEGAATAYRRALSLPCSEPERRFLERRLAELASES